MNHTAQYIATYGMENLDSFVEIPGIFGNLQQFLDRDMGVLLTFHLFNQDPALQVQVLEQEVVIDLIASDSPISLFGLDEHDL